MTIFALSSGPGISGVAVIRISGASTKDVIKVITKGAHLKPRVATLNLSGLILNLSRKNKRVNR